MCRGEGSRATQRKRLAFAWVSQARVVCDPSAGIDPSRGRGRQPLSWKLSCRPAGLCVAILLHVLTCPSCAKPNRTERRYCGGCGHALVVRCGRCDFSNGWDDHFCGGCGEATGATAQSVPRPAARPVLPVHPVHAVPAAADNSRALRKLEASEVEAMLTPGTAGPAPKTRARVSQDELDALFGSKS